MRGLVITCNIVVENVTPFLALEELYFGKEWGRLAFLQSAIFAARKSTAPAIIALHLISKGDKTL